MMENKELIPIVDKRRLHKIGAGYAIFIPKKWFRAHDLDPDEIVRGNGLLMMGNLDIRVVNPLHEAKVYKAISKTTKEAEVTIKGSEGNEH